MSTSTTTSRLSGFREESKHQNREKGAADRLDPTTRGPLLILANPLNELTFGDRCPTDVGALDLAAFQEFWLIERGDVFVTPRPMPRSFIEAVCKVTGVSEATFDIVDAGARPEETVVEALQRSGAVRQLRQLVARRPGIQIRACGVDRTVVKLAAELGAPIEGYSEPIANSLLDLIYQINTKDGFRRIAETLGLPTASGFTCASSREAEKVARRLQRHHGAALVKCSRGAGGGGQFSLDRTADATQQLKAFLKQNAALGHCFVVETLLKPKSEPTIDVEITAEGPRHLYIGTMEVAHGAFQGMAVPASLSGRALKDLRDAADSIGRYLFERGYRGFFDLDAAELEGDRLVVFEANVRRTSTSLWDAVLNRLFAGANSPRVMWTLASTTVDTVAPEKLIDVLAELASASTSPSDRKDISLLTWTICREEIRIRYLLGGESREDLEIRQAHLRTALDSSTRIYQ